MATLVSSNDPVLSKNDLSTTEAKP